MKILRRIHRVLAGHGVGHKQNLLWREQLFQALHLGHQFLVHVQAAGGVDDQRVAAHDDSFAARFFGQPLHKRRAGWFALLIALVQPGLDGLGDDLQLLARSRPVDVDRNQHRPVPTLLEPCGQLAGDRRFARALQPGHQNDGRRLGGEVEARRVFAKQSDQLVAHNLDHLLGGRECGEHFGPHGLFANVLDQVADNLEVNVGFEQSHANLAQGFGDVFFSERALAAKAFEHTLQLVRKILKHGQFLVYRTSCRGAET